MRDYYLLNEYIIIEEEKNVYNFDKNIYETKYKEIRLSTYHELVKYLIRQYEINTNNIIYDRSKLINQIYFEIVTEFDQEIDCIKVDLYLIQFIESLIIDFNE
jgi:hypothetical protein